MKLISVLWTTYKDLEFFHHSCAYWNSEGFHQVLQYQLNVLGVARMLLLVFNFWTVLLKKLWLLLTCYRIPCFLQLKIIPIEKLQHSSRMVRRTVHASWMVIFFVDGWGIRELSNGLSKWTESYVLFFNVENNQRH